MHFEIVFGIPEMEDFWNNLYTLNKSGKAKKNDVILYNKLIKTFQLLSKNPFHPSLKTHDIDSLTRRYNHKVWQSYIENRTSKARRLFWVYGPTKEYITVIGIEPHPEDKNNAYARIVLSDLPSLK